MVDVLTKNQRSILMSKVRSKWSKLEKRVHNRLKAEKIKHKMHPKMFGSPDILVGEKKAIFIDSCFWHGCSKHKTQIPTTNRNFWVAKIKANKARDRKVTRVLRGKGYKIVRIWEHELRYIDKVMNKIRERS